MEINRKNYEIFFLDYKEGNLSDEQSAELMLFLNLNEDLLVEFDNFEIFSLEPEQTASLFDTNSLKKDDFSLNESINKANYQNYFIAYHENDLTLKEVKQVEDFIQKFPNTSNDFQLYGKLKIQPDRLINYPYKSSLKKKSANFKYIQYAFYATAVAASVLVFLNLFYSSSINKVFNSNTIEGFANLNNAANIALTKSINMENASNTVFSAKIKNSNIKVNNIQNIEIDAKSLASMKPRKINQIDIESSDNNLLNRNNLVEMYANNNLFENFTSEGTASVDRTGKEQINAIAQWTVNKVKSKINPKYKEEPVEPIKLNGWELVNLGLSGINAITESNLKLTRNIDDNGNLTAYSFSSNNFAFSKSLNK